MADETSIKRPPSELTHTSQETDSTLVKQTESGRQAWLTVGGSFLVYYASFGIVNSFGFFQNYYSKHFLEGVPASTIALVGTLQIALMNLLSGVSGALCDMYGIRYLYIASGYGISGSLVALSFTSTGAVWQIFVIQGFLMGVAVAFGAQPALTVAGQHFNQRRALAMGIVTAGCGVGGVCFPIMLSKLMPMVGFAWTLRLAAMKIMIFYAVGLYMSTSKLTHREDTFHWGTLLDFNGFRDRRYSVLSAGAWLAQLGLWVPTYFIESYCTAIYPDAPVRVFLVALINGCGICGTITAGLLGDQFGRLNILWPATMMLGFLCMSLWVLERSLKVLMMFVCIYGYFSGFFSALLPPSISQISPREKMGARMGAFYSIIAVASLIGTPIGGSLITDPNTRGGYQKVILFSGGTLVLGSFTMFVCRLLHSRDLRAKW